jgi:uncharacterized membrane protein YukC
MKPKNITDELHLVSLDPDSPTPRNMFLTPEIRDAISSLAAGKEVAANNNESVANMYIITTLTKLITTQQKTDIDMQHLGGSVDKVNNRLSEFEKELKTLNLQALPGLIVTVEKMQREQSGIKEKLTYVNDNTVTILAELKVISKSQRDELVKQYEKKEAELAEAKRTTYTWIGMGLTTIITLILAYISYVGRNK